MKALNVLAAVLWAGVFAIFIFDGNINPITEGGAYALLSAIFVMEAIDE